MECSKILVQGSKHIEDRVCEDAAAFIQPEEQIVIAAVSDGCSNAKLSDIGSSMVVKSFLDVFSDYRILTQYIKDDNNLKNMKYGDIIKSLITEPEKEALCVSILLSSIRRNIIRFLETTGCDYSVLSSTFIGVIVFNQIGMIFHVGDGFVSSISGKKIDIVSEPDNFLSKNITHFITSPDAEEHLRITRINHFDRLMLSTDGLTKLFDIKNPLHVKKIIQISKKNSELQNFIKAIHDQFYDDCGIVLITHHNTLF